MCVCVCVAQFRRNCGGWEQHESRIIFFKRNRRGRRESLEDRRGVEAWSADPWTGLTNRRPSRRRIRRGRASVGPVGNRPGDTPSFRTGQPRRTVAGPSSPIPTGTHRTTTGTEKKKMKGKGERGRICRWSVKVNHHLCHLHRYRTFKPFVIGYKVKNVIASGFF